jgi:hypothetical protein
MLTAFCAASILSLFARSAGELNIFARRKSIPERLTSTSFLFNAKSGATDLVDGFSGNIDLKLFFKFSSGELFFKSAKGEAFFKSSKIDIFLRSFNIEVWGAQPANKKIATTKI